MSVSDITNATAASARQAIAAAKAEIAQEQLRKGIDKLKTKLREQAAAKLVYENVNREIEELQMQLEQGSV